MSHLVLTVLVISGIGALLAFLLELADSFIANYGECQITINQEKNIAVKGGSPLLFSLQEEGIFIPSACGGKGTCAYCKVKVLEGGGPVLPTETPYLSAQELEERVRLSCQVKVRNDLSIEVPEDLFSIQEFTVRVENILNLNSYVKELTLEILTLEEGITFKPGQYIQLEVPKYKLSRGPEYRAFSIASSPDELEKIKLYVGIVEKGVVSTYIHRFLKSGDKIIMRGPFGDFYYRESDRDILMIATGTGLAPIMSILSYMHRKKIQRRATLFFGTRTEEDLYCVKELREMEKQLFGFQYIPTLSREKKDSGWKGERGRVTALIDKSVPQEANVDVYICGNPDMVESCLDRLKEKGISEDRIYFDKFA
jgi:Na+-transporting NADH:ubiquinone oxidoreductase subunit F